jgi:Ca2+-binding RTX toxin-like protein
MTGNVVQQNTLSAGSTTHDYTLTMSRADDGQGVLTFTAGTISQSFSAWWDDSTPWEAGNYELGTWRYNNAAAVNAWVLENQPVGRSAILIHPGNSSGDSEGCFVTSGITNIATIQNLIAQNNLDLADGLLVVQGNFSAGVALTSQPGSVAEGTGARLTVSLTGSGTSDGVSRDMYFFVSAQPGSPGANFATDFDFGRLLQANPGTVVFGPPGFVGPSPPGFWVHIPPNQGSVTVTLPTVVDADEEGPESFTFQITDYVIERVNTGGKHRTYQDDSRLYLNPANSPDLGESITISDTNSILNQSVSAGGGSEGYQQTHFFLPGQQLSYQFDPFTIPDRFILRDATSGTTLLDTGFVGNGQTYTGAVTVNINGDGGLQIEVDGNSDPNTAWTFLLSAMGMTPNVVRAEPVAGEEDAQQTTPMEETAHAPVPLDTSGPVPATVSGFALTQNGPTVTEDDGSEDGYGAGILVSWNGPGTPTVGWRIVGTGSSPADAADFGGTLPSGSIGFGAGVTGVFIEIRPPSEGVAEGAEQFRFELFDLATGIALADVAPLEFTIASQLSVPALALGAGNDSANTFHGGADVDVYAGNGGADVIYGAAASDGLDGGSGNDVLYGGDGEDTLQGRFGNDTVFGGTGLDTLLFPRNSADVLIDATANGFAVSDGGSWLDLGADQISGVEYIQLSDGRIDLSQLGLADQLLVGVPRSGGLLSVDPAPLAGLGASGEFGYQWYRSADGVHWDAIAAFGASYAPSADDVGHELRVTVYFEGSGFIGLLQSPSSGPVGTVATGSVVADTMLGTDGPDWLVAAAGNDFVVGLAADDTLDGGPGADTIDGGDGNDTLIGGAGNDLIVDSGTGTGDHVSYADAGSAVVLVLGGTATSGSDVDQVFGVENATGTSLADTIYGSAVGNTLWGGAGADVLVGGDGNDLLVGDSGNDRLYGGIGTDTVDYSGATGTTIGAGSAITVSLTSGETDTLFEVESITGLVLPGGSQSLTPTIDVATFGSGNDIADALAGNDTLYGGTGDDTFYGNAGLDVLYGDDNNDRLSGDAGSDTLYGGAGTDTADFGLPGIAVVVDLVQGTANDGAGGSDRLYGMEDAAGGNGNDFIFGNDGPNVLDGRGGADTLIGWNGIDRLYGGPGHDILIGWAGNDTIWGGDGIDLLDLQLATAGAVVRFDQGSVTDGLGGLDTVSDVENVIGTTLADAMTGDGAANFLIGYHGNDTLSGGDAADILAGGNDQDTLYGGGSDDLATGEAGHDRVNGGDGNDFLIGWTGDDSLLGEAGNDSLAGDAGNDSIDGGVGNDLAVGGEGIDTLWGGDGSDSLFAWLDNDLVFGGAGDDTIAGDDGSDVLYGATGNDLMVGSAGVDTVFGEGNNDTLSGLGETDLLYGADGNDLIAGDAGNDTIWGGTGTDLAVGGEGTDLVLGEDGDDTLFGWLDNDVVYGAAGRDLVGGDAGSDLIYGGNDDDDLFGDAGADTVRGEAGIDFVVGVDGNDTLYGGADTDYLFGGAGSDTLYGGTGDQDVFVFQPGDGVARIADWEDPNDFIDVSLFGYHNMSAFAAAGGSIADPGGAIRTVTITFATGGPQATLTLGPGEVIDSIDFLFA